MLVPTILMSRAFPTAGVVSALLISCAAAQTKRLDAGVGVIAAPAYIGSDELVVVPVPTFTLERENFAIRPGAAGLEIDLSRGNRWSYGGILSFDGGRNDVIEASDDRAALLPTVEGTLQLGGFIRRNVSLAGTRSGSPLFLSLGASAVQATGGHEGALAEVSVGLLRPRKSWTTGFSVSATYADEAYHESYFSLDADDAALVALDPFEAEAGTRDVRVSVFGSRPISKGVTIGLFGSYAELLGDAADSPVTAELGQTGQVSLGVTLSRRFQ